jgi:hypothetical protein
MTHETRAPGVTARDVSQAWRRPKVVKWSASGTRPEKLAFTACGRVQASVGAREYGGVTGQGAWMMSWTGGGPRVANPQVLLAVSHAHALRSQQTLRQSPLLFGSRVGHGQQDHQDASPRQVRYRPPTPSLPSGPFR